MGATKRVQDALNWADALGAAPSTDAVPAGWMTTNQIAVEINLSREQASRKIRERVAAGKCEVRSFRITTGGVTRPVPHYRLKG